jgi:hypothetical protein
LIWNRYRKNSSPDISKTSTTSYESFPTNKLYIFYPCFGHFYNLSFPKKAWNEIVKVVYIFFIIKDLYE